MRIRVALLCWAVFALAAPLPAVASDSRPAESTGEAGIDWVRIALQRLPVVPRTAVRRWPLVLWNSLDPRSLSASTIRWMLDRGIAPTIGLHPDYLAAARRIAEAGGPVIALQARGGDWPYRAGRPLDVLDLGAWSRAADTLRDHLARFVEAGIEIQAAWLDYENAPVNLAPEDVDLHRPGMPAGDAGDFRTWRRQLWMSLLSAYVAAPLREAYPAISVTNWVVSASHPEQPLLDWYNRPHPRTDIGLFTATNPVAYGHDIAYAYNRPRRNDARHVDAAYTHVLLRQVSADARARHLDAPHLDAVAWVSRRVVDIHEQVTPVMSREAYREVLRHLWLRGVDAMMVFNPRSAGGPGMLHEIEDAAMVYREMLAHADVLDGGRVVNTEVPPATAPVPYWSAVRNGQRAVLRLTNPGTRDATVAVSLWPGHEEKMTVAPGGITRVVERP